jgi:hypothetical protein
MASSKSPASFANLLNQVGVTKALQKVRFGGVVGKQTLLGIACVIGLAFISWRAEPSAMLWIAILVVVLVGLIAILNFVYANKHPMEATLEGAEIIAWQHHVVASKTAGELPSSNVVPNPEGPPQLPPAQGEDVA